MTTEARAALIRAHVEAALDEMNQPNDGRRDERADAIVPFCAVAFEDQESIDPASGARITLSIPFVRAVTGDGVVRMRFGRPLTLTELISELVNRSDHVGRAIRWRAGA